MQRGYVMAYTAVIAAAISGLGGVCPARVAAEPFPIGGTYAVNGRYSAVSDGQWAKTLERFQDEATVTSTWTFNTTCPNPFRCTGQVSSDQGWTVPTHSTSGTWYVTRDVDQWQPCDDGTTAPGHEMFLFYPQDATTLVGMDKTIGNSGACGHSRPLVKEFPFKLTRL